MSLLFCHVTSTVYYMIPTTGNQSCPTDQECHTLSYYINNITLPSNVTLLFINGEHLLKANETLQIKGLNNVTLLGQGQWIQGFHQSVIQSSVIIKCIYTTSIAVNVSTTTFLYINNVTITHCSRGIVIDSVSDAHLNDLSAQNNIEYGLLINNTATVTIDSCSFSYNGVNTFLNLVKTVDISYSNFTYGQLPTYNWHASGLTIHPINSVEGSNIPIVITGCIVHSNVGGGASVYITDCTTGTCMYSNYTIIMTNTIFSNNSRDDGGGLYINIHAVHSEIVVSGVKFLNNTRGADLDVQTKLNNIVILQDTTFIRNNNGGLYLRLSGTRSLMTLIKHSIFQHNVSPVNGQIGGALIYMFGDRFSSDISLYIHNTIFDSNTRVALYINTNADVKVTDVHIVKTVNNNPPQLFQYTAALQLICTNHIQVTLSNVHITNNYMTGILLIGCQVFFIDISSIISNNKSPGNGGGIYADDNVVFYSSVPVHFINNTATQYGGAIYSTANLVSSVSNQMLYYSVTECTFTDFNATFSNNYAQIAGNDIYGGSYYELDRFIPHFIDVVYSISDSISAGICFPMPLSSITSAPVGACICINNSYINCTQRVHFMKVYPGQTIKLFLVTVGMSGNISPGIIVTKGTGVNVTLDEADQITDIHCKNFTYQVKANTTTNTEGKITIETSGSLQLNGSILTIDITLLPCPLGLVLDNSLGMCVCDDIINVVKPQCNVSWMPYPIKRSGNNWLSNNKEHNCIIAHTNCPFNYCNTSLISLNLNNTDLQCTHNRSGHLCGQCQPGLSLMLGSNKCGVCTNFYIALTAAFVFAGLCLCVLLLTLNLTVSVGSINGLLFYANMVKLNKSVLFSNKQIPVLNQFIAWLNLDLGIETCFFNGLDGYWKTWLQFAFSLSLITGIIICCRYSGKLSRLCGNNVVPALSTLILMAHSKLLITIKNTLMLSRVQCEHTIFNVWSVDGNIKYLHNKHIPLFVVSLIFFFIGLIYTGVMFFGQWLQRYTGRYCSSSIDPFIVLKPFIDAYYGPFKDKYQFVTGLLLMIRMFVTGLFAVTTGTIPQANNYIITIIAFVLLPVVSRGIYRIKVNTVLEMFFLFNLGLMSLLNTVSNHPIFIYYVDVVSISLSLLVFVGIVLCHIYMYIKLKCGVKLYAFRQRYLIQVDEEDSSLQERSSDRSEDEAELYSPARTVHRRESLIFDLELTGHHHDT